MDIDKEVRSIVAGLDLPESTTREDLAKAIATELQLRTKAEAEGTKDSADVIARLAALEVKQTELADQAIAVRNTEEVARKVTKDISTADKSDAVRHADELHERAMRVMPRGVPIDSFEVAEIDKKGRGERSHRACDLDKLYLFPTKDPLVESWKSAMEDAYAVSAISGVPVRETKLWQQYERLNPDFVKAMAGATSGSGSDWIPTGYSDQVIDLVRVPHALIEKHPHVVMPTARYVMPTVSSDLTVYIAGERTADDDVKFTASTMGTSTKTLTAKTLAVRSVFSGQFDEDSIIPVLPSIRTDLAFALRSALDDAMVNGDTTATHHDTGYTVASNDHRRLWRGYIETALTYDGSTNIVDLTSITWEKVVTLQEKLAQYGAQGAETLMWVTGYKGYRVLKTLKDSSNNNIIVNDGAARGDQSVNTLDGIQVIQTDKVGGNLNASGIYDASITAFTDILLVYRPAYVIGDRRALQLKVVDKPEEDQQALVGLLRIACTNVYESSTHFTVAMGYNFT